ncbi:hypothetical protein L542_0074 [Bordetella bronchiseptica F-1]|nr:hypothetical protein L542_0074 [Bordetella bronchiseptica F-1]
MNWFDAEARASYSESGKAKFLSEMSELNTTVAPSLSFL